MILFYQSKKDKKEGLTGDGKCCPFPKIQVPFQDMVANSQDELGKHLH